MATGSEAHADHGVTATTTTTATTTDDTRPRDGLLTGTGRLGRRLRLPRFALLLAVRFFAARPRVVLVIILAAGRSCRRRRLLVGDAGLAFQSFAGFALDRA